MKNITLYNSKKYDSKEYKQIEEGIYKTLHYNDEKNLSLKGVQDKKILKKLNKKSIFGRKIKWIKSPEKNASKFLTTYLDGKKYYKSQDDVIFEQNGPEEIYVLSIRFEQEPEYNENEPSDKTISQYPLEDILDKFLCYCNDFYEEENANDNKYSYIEFASTDINNVKELKSIIGKHVYNKEEDKVIKLIIE